VIVNDTCAIHARFMRDSSAISTPDTPTILSISRFVSDSCVIGCVTGP